MLYDSEYIHRLITDEISGLITEEDKACLHRVIAGNKEAHALWQQMHSVLDDVEVKTRLDAATGPIAFEEVQRRIKRNRRVIYIRRAASIAAILIVAAGLFYIMEPGHKGNNLAVSKDAKRIELVLADGNTIDLSQQQGQVQVGGITLNNNKKSLTYSSINDKAPAFATLKVPVGKDYKVQLADGTEVWLNAASTLVFPLSFTGKTREVTINGEAYLEVAKNAGQPFIVHLPGGSVQVLGTAFNVNTYDSGRLQVALVEGSVKMRVAKDSLVLKPGLLAAYSVQQGMKVSGFDADQVLSWRDGIFHFRDTPLEEVFRVIPRWFGVDVVMDSKQTALDRFTGIIDRNRPIQESLDALKALNGIDYYFDKDSVLHIR